MVSFNNSKINANSVVDYSDSLLLDENVVKEIFLPCLSVQDCLNLARTCQKWNRLIKTQFTKEMMETLKKIHSLSGDHLNVNPEEFIKFAFPEMCYLFQCYTMQELKKNEVLCTMQLQVAIRAGVAQIAARFLGRVIQKQQSLKQTGGDPGCYDTIDMETNRAYSKKRLQNRDVTVDCGKLSSQIEIFGTEKTLNAWINHQSRWICHIEEKYSGYAWMKAHYDIEARNAEFEDREELEEQWDYVIDAHCGYRKAVRIVENTVRQQLSQIFRYTHYSMLDFDINRMACLVEKLEEMENKTEHRVTHLFSTALAAHLLHVASHLGKKEELERKFYSKLGRAPAGVQLLYLGLKIKEAAERGNWKDATKWLKEVSIDEHTVGFFHWIADLPVRSGIKEAHLFFSHAEKLCSNQVSIFHIFKSEEDPYLAPLKKIQSKLSA